MSIIKASVAALVIILALTFGCKPNESAPLVVAGMQYKILGGELRNVTLDSLQAEALKRRILVTDLAIYPLEFSRPGK